MKGRLERGEARPEADQDDHPPAPETREFAMCNMWIIFLSLAWAFSDIIIIIIYRCAKKVQKLDTCTYMCSVCKVMFQKPVQDNQPNNAEAVPRGQDQPPEIEQTEHVCDRWGY